MAFIEWNEKLSVGVPLFDDEHKELVHLINLLDQAIKVGESHHTMDNTISGLINYTVKHFQDEEAAMKKYEYPNYESHKKEHQDLTEEVKNFYERFKSGQSKFTIELLKFLRDWIINHIMASDMAYKDFFKGKEV